MSAFTQAVNANASSAGLPTSAPSVAESGSGFTSGFAEDGGGGAAAETAAETTEVATQEPGEAAAETQETAAATEVDPATEEAVEEANTQAQAPAKFKADAKALESEMASIRAGSKEPLPDWVVKKLANQALYIKSLKGDTGAIAVEGADEVEGDGLTEYERSLGIKPTRAVKSPTVATTTQTATATAATAPPAANSFEAYFGPNYQNLIKDPDAELEHEAELMGRFREGKAKPSEIRQATVQKMGRQLFYDQQLRTIQSEIIRQELELAGISVDALREVSAETFDAKDWNFALDQLQVDPGMRKVTSPETITLPNGKRVQDTPLNRLMRDNWEDISDIHVSGKDAQQTSILSKMKRARVLLKIHGNQQNSAKLMNSAAQSGVKAGQKVAVANAKGNLNGGGTTAAPANSKASFEPGNGSERYSDRFTKDRAPKFSELVGDKIK